MNKLQKTRAKENGDQWLSIDSAPKNERFLIAGYCKNNITGKKYPRMEIAFHTEGNLIVIDDYNENESYLPEGLWLEAYTYDGHSEGIYVKVNWIVTHWMPLPKNPN